MHTIAIQSLLTYITGYLICAKLIAFLFCTSYDSYYSSQLRWIHCLKLLALKLRLIRGIPINLPDFYYVSKHAKHVGDRVFWHPQRYLGISFRKFCLVPFSFLLSLAGILLFVIIQECYFQIEAKKAVSMCVDLEELVGC